MKGLASVLAKVFDSSQKGFLRNVLAGAGLTLASTAGVSTLVNQYIAKVQSQTANIGADMLAILHLSGIDFALSVILSAVVSRVAINQFNLTLQKVK